MPDFDHQPIKHTSWSFGPEEVERAHQLQQELTQQLTTAEGNISAHGQPEAPESNRPSFTLYFNNHPQDRDGLPTAGTAESHDYAGRFKIVDDPEKSKSPLIEDRYFIQGTGIEQTPDYYRIYTNPTNNQKYLVQFARDQNGKFRETAGVVGSAYPLTQQLQQAWQIANAFLPKNIVHSQT